MRCLRVSAGVSAISVMRAPLIYHPRAASSTSRGADGLLERLELLERLAAALAVADRAARRGAEEILELRLRRAAVRTAEAALELDEVELRRDPRCGRRETGSAELLAAGGGDVVRRPRVVQADADLRVEAELADLLLHRVPHHFERGTAHERRCELDSRRSCVDGHVLHDTEVDERDHGDLGIGDLGERLPDRLGGHHCAPADAERIGPELVDGLVQTLASLRSPE